MATTPQAVARAALKLLLDDRLEVGKGSVGGRLLHVKRVMDITMDEFDAGIAYGQERQWFEVHPNYQRVTLGPNGKRA